MNKIKGFVLSWVHNSVLIYLASQVFKGKFVLGTKNLTLLAAVILSGFLVALLLVVGNLAISKIKKIRIEGITKIIVFYALNSISLWLVARIAPYSGFGVVKFTWLLGLAVFTTLIQVLMANYK